MVRSPDYVYGIIPDSGEYGFEHQPAIANDPVRSRVQSLAGSFQWVGADTENPIAIAVDRGAPNLISRFVTDPGDPDGRLSVRMHVWLCGSDHELTETLRANWPDEHSLPITLQAFTTEVTEQTVGRWVVGPADQFDAVDFNRNWGGRSSKPQPTTTRRPNAASRNTKQQRPVYSSSSIWPKLIASLMTLVAMVSIGAAVKFYWDFERVSTAAAQTSTDLRDAEEKLANLQAKLDSANHAIEQSLVEIRRQRRSIEESRTKIAENEAELAKQMGEVDRLNEIIAINPETNIQKELDDLRLFKTAVKKYFADTLSALEQLENASPGQPGVAEKFKSTFQDVFNGKAKTP